MFPDGMDISGLLAQAQAMQDQMVRAQEELANTRVQGSAGGDLVEVELSGTGELLNVVIKPEACDPEDTESLGDLIVAAVRDGMTKVQAVTAAKMPAMPELPF